MRKSFLRRYASKAAMLVSLAALVSSCAASIPSQGEPWRSYMNNDARGNLSPDAVTVPMAKAWDRDISASTLFKGYKKAQLASPALSDGVIFVGSTNEKFYSMEMSSGKVLWQFDAGYPIEAPPAVTEDRVCFGSSDGFMRCFDRGGALLWEFRARSEILSSPVIRDGMVFFSSSDDRLYALDAATGAKAWNYTRRVFKTVTPRIYASSAWADGRLYHFFSDGTLVCLSASNGTELWSKKIVKDFDKAQATRRTPLVMGPVVYAIDDNNAVVALNASTGEVKGIYNIIKAHDFVLPDRNTLVIAGADRVVSINISTGAILWDKTLLHSPMESVFAAGGYLFVLSNYEARVMGIYFITRTKGYVEALSLADGQTAWTRRLDSSVSANGAAAQSAVVLLPNSGELALFTSP